MMPYGDLFGRHPTARDPSQDDDRDLEVRLERAVDELEEAATELIETVLPALPSAPQGRLVRRVVQALEDEVRQRVIQDYHDDRREARRDRGA